MNIWCISKYASLPEYGPGARLVYLAKEFKALGHETYLITSDANHLANFPETNHRYNFEKHDGVDVCWINTKKYKTTASAARILSWFDFEWKLFQFPKRKFSKPDVVIISSLSIFSIVYGYFLKKKYGAFLIFEIRDIWPLTMTAEGGFSKWHPLTLFIGWIEKFGYKKSDLIVGTMPKLNLHVEQVIKNGAEKSFFCSPLGFDESAQGAIIEAQHELDQYFKPNKITIGYAGSMGLTNALEPFIECMEKFKNNHDIQFVLVGGGDLKDDYEKRLADHGNVTFVPKIQQKYVQYFLSQCDILYLSTHDSVLWRYGQSMNKLVQYMLAGKPIIASYSGYQTMLNEADSGVFVPANAVEPLYEALVNFISKPSQELAEIGQRGRKWILANRSYKQLASEYIKAIEEYTRTFETNPLKKVEHLQ